MILFLAAAAWGVELTPKVIRDSSDAFRATQDLKRRLHSLAPPLTPEPDAS